MFTNLRSKVANLSTGFLNPDADHQENEDESAVSRALRDYYRQKDGFIPDWLTPIAAAPTMMNNAGPNRQSGAASVPPRMQTGGAMLGDIFGDAPPPQQQQQLKQPAMGMQRPGTVGPMGRNTPPMQQAYSAPPLPPQQQQQQGLPSKPKGGIRPFMAMKKEQQQTQTPSPPPQQYNQPPPLPQYQQPPREQSYGSQPSGGNSGAGQRLGGLRDRMLNKPSSGGGQAPAGYAPSQNPQPPPRQGYSGGGGSGGGAGRRFAAAAGEQGSSAPPPQSNQYRAGGGGGRREESKPFMSATAPWSGGGNDDYSGWGGAPGFYGK